MMENASDISVWIDEGYGLFAEAGFAGICIERLAGTLGLNKSGFNYYFGGLDGFCTELLDMHEKKITVFTQDICKIKTLDPEYLHLLIEHSETVMFQVQLLKTKRSHAFFEAGEKNDQRIRFSLFHVWCDYLGILKNPSLAMRCYNIVRDMLYSRINVQNLNYQYLHNLVNEAKSIIGKIEQPMTLQKGNFFG
jgi:AcrR family transcriptional regulator